MQRARESLAERQHHLGRANAFGLLRLTLASGIIAFHAVTLTQGHADGVPPLIQAAGRLILPAFFVLSGFLVTASLQRAASVREFLLLRVLRLMPALCVVVAGSALVLGPLASRVTVTDYFSDPLLPRYFLNIWGVSQFHLPGLFDGNPRAGTVNGALWTIPLEMACYVLLALGLSGLPRRMRLGVVGLIALMLVLPLPGLSVPFQNMFAAFVMGVLLQTAGSRLPHHAIIGIGALAAALWMAHAFPYMALGMVPLAYSVVWLGLMPMPAWRGDYSYGLYLTAYPLQQLWIQILPGQNWQVSLMAGGLSALACAVLLWHGVERPALNRKHEMIARAAGRTARMHAR